VRQRVQALGIPSKRIHVIPNWCDDLKIQPLAQPENPLRQAWGLQGKFVCGYSGNLGRAHEFDTVLAAAELLRDNPRIVFLMIGGGKRFDELARAVKERALASSFRFMPYQERKMLSRSLGAPDLHWLSLKPELEGLIVPSKFYGIAAAGKPMIVIADRNGELAQLVQEHGCGVVIEPGDAGALVGALWRLSNEPGTITEMGIRARKMLDAHFTRQKAFERWYSLLDQLEQFRL
jgi:colanic acid biosynthesis glycosyl transferase WcaI